MTPTSITGDLAGRNMRDSDTLPVARPAHHRQNDWLERHWRLALGSIFAVAFLLRLAYVVWSGWDDTLPDALVDQLLYVDLGRNLTLGHGFAYSWPALVSTGGPTVEQSPLYPAILGLMFKAFGLHYLPIRLLQVVIGALTCVNCALVAKMLGNRRAGLVAGLGFSLYPLAIMLSRPLMTETLAVFLFSLVALLVLQFTECPKAWLIVGLALTIGLAYLTAYQLLPGIVVLLAWSALRLRRLPKRILLGYASLLLAIVGLTLAPWALRNLSQFQSLAMVPTKSSRILWENSWLRYMQETSVEFRVWGAERVAIADYATLTEFERSDRYREQAGSFIRQQPVAYGKYTLTNLFAAYPLLPREDLPPPLGWRGRPRHSDAILSLDEIAGMDPAIGDRVFVYRSDTSLEHTSTYQTGWERVRVWTLRLWFIFGCLALIAKYRNGGSSLAALTPIVTILLVNIVGMALTKGEERYRFLTDPFLIILGSIWLEHALRRLSVFFTADSRRLLRPA